MNRIVVMLVVGLVVLGGMVLLAEDKPAPAGDKPAVAAPGLATQQQKASYCLGMFLGRNLKRQGVPSALVDPAAFMKGFQSSMSGGKPALANDEMQKVMKAFQASVDAHNKTLAGENLKKGEAFLAANAKKEGIKTTASGLQYKVVVEGKGKSPKATDTVLCNYRGTLIDGSEFDASGKEPAEFSLARVIPAWTEGLQLMKEGGKCMLYVPAKLAYRDSPSGPGGANSALIFEVELVKVK